MERGRRDQETNLAYSTRDGAKLGLTEPGSAPFAVEQNITLPAPSFTSK